MSLIGNVSSPEALATQIDNILPNREQGKPCAIIPEESFFIILFFTAANLELHPDQATNNVLVDALQLHELGPLIGDEKFLSGSLLALRQLYHIPFDALTTIRANMEEYAQRRVKSMEVCYSIPHNRKHFLFNTFARIYS